MAAKRTRKLVADKSSGRSFFDALPRNNTTAGSSSAAPLVISDGNPVSTTKPRLFLYKKGCVVLLSSFLLAV